MELGGEDRVQLLLQRPSDGGQHGEATVLDFCLTDYESHFKGEKGDPWMDKMPALVPGSSRRRRSTM